MRLTMAVPPGASSTMYVCHKGFAGSSVGAEVEVRVALPARRHQRQVRVQHARLEALVREEACLDDVEHGLEGNAAAQRQGRSDDHRVLDPIHPEPRSVHMAERVSV